MEADLHNLTPAVGELNGDRSNLPYGIVDGEPREYGTCDFEIGGKPAGSGAARPSAGRRGADLALHGRDLLNQITDGAAKADPVDSWERLRDRRIQAVQGNKNPYVSN